MAVENCSISVIAELFRTFRLWPADDLVHLLVVRNMRRIKEKIVKRLVPYAKGF